MSMRFRTPENVVVIGLSGGICAGKTTATSVLEESFGAKVFNADLFGHEAYLPGTDCLHSLVAHFGDRILNPQDGTVDRKVLGSIVFSDKSEMEALNRIVWPAIRNLLEQKMFEYASQLDHSDKQQPQLIVLEAAVMVEAKWMDLADEVWILTVPREVARDRLMKRNQLTEEQALARIDAQISNEERRKVAHVEITNDSDEASFRKQLHEKAQALRERYSKLSAMEFVDVVDKDDNVLTHAKRGVVRGFDLIHRVSYMVLVHKPTGHIYVQERSELKDSGPGLLDPAPGGVLSAGESYEENVRREMNEEMGLTGLQCSSLCKLYHEHAVDGKTWGTIFTAEIDADPAELKLQPEEVNSVQLLSITEILTRSPQDFLPGGLAAFKKFITFSEASGGKM